MIRIIIITAFILSANILFAQYYMVVNKADGTETVTAVGDIEDITFSDIECGVATVSYSGKTYNTVQIGNQCWLKENLDVGTRIDGSLNQTNNGGSNEIEKYCYDDDDANCTTYGGLYQWNEAMQYVTTEGTQGICPSGWHIPTLAEFTTLKSEVSDDGNALKAGGTNTSGFSALLAGNRNDNGLFGGLEGIAYFWSSTEYDEPSVYNLHLTGNNSSITLSENQKINGFSVRCLKD